MIDVDDFKRLNDARPQGGDEALRHLADLLRPAASDRCGGAPAARSS
jgi:PleD family two-component response regulator